MTSHGHLPTMGPCRHCRLVAAVTACFFLCSFCSLSFQWGRTFYRACSFVGGGGGGNERKCPFDFHHGPHTLPSLPPRQGRRQSLLFRTLLLLQQQQQQQQPQAASQSQDEETEFSSSTTTTTTTRKNEFGICMISLPAPFGEDDDELLLLLQQQQQQQQQQQEQVHSVKQQQQQQRRPSRPRPPPIVRKLWHWKDVALGNGRDYFVPRPRALRAFNDALVGQKWRLKEDNDNDSSYLTIQECAVLSNCARLEIYLRHQVHNTNNTNNTTNTTTTALRHLVANALLQQYSWYQQDGPQNWISQSISSLLDLPMVTTTTTAATTEEKNGTTFSSSSSLADDNSDNNDDDDDGRHDLWKHLIVVEKEQEVIFHACLVAAGLALRPNKRTENSHGVRRRRTSSTQVVFRPFSSGDAHVMLQMKRSSEAARGSLVKTIFHSALSAGKAARTVQKVPEIELLRDYQKSGKYAMEAPAHLQQWVVEAALKKAIHPTVDSCWQQLRSQTTRTTSAVVELRRAAAQLLHQYHGPTATTTATTTSSSSSLSLQDNLTVRQMLHQPCLQLRQGQDVDTHALLQDIEAYLKQQQSQEG